MIRRPPRSTHCISSAASDVYKRQGKDMAEAEAKAWKTIWSAGHGVSSINDNPACKDLIDKLKLEFIESIQSQKSNLKYSDNNY